MKVIIFEKNQNAEGHLTNLSLRLKAQNQLEKNQLLEKAGEIRSVLKSMNLHDVSFDWSDTDEGNELQIDASHTTIREITAQGKKMQLVVSNILKKVNRIGELFYPEKKRTWTSVYDYDVFLESLIQQRNTYLKTRQTLTDDRLFQMGSLLQNIDKLIQQKCNPSLLDKTSKSPQEVIQHLQENPIIKSSGACAFCDPKVLSTQVLFEGYFFRINFNYLPYGLVLGKKPPFHLMVIPIQHNLVLSSMSRAQIIEFKNIAEILFKEAKSQQPKKSPVCFSQEHGAGMTVPHLHLHVVSPSSQRDYWRNLETQIRCVAGETNGRPAPLSVEYMAEKRKTDGPRLRKEHLESFLENCLTAGLFAPPKAICLKENPLEKKPINDQTVQKWHP